MRKNICRQKDNLDHGTEYVEVTEGTQDAVKEKYSVWFIGGHNTARVQYSELSAFCSNCTASDQRNSEQLTWRGATERWGKIKRVGKTGCPAHGCWRMVSQQCQMAVAVGSFHKTKLLDGLIEEDLAHGLLEKGNGKKAENCRLGQSRRIGHTAC
eukprot:GHVS01021551.1.p1 GENE.GHVS01021551.1~~GHVS01021551.1.p1  ORF type:complete len:155 (+),score=15.32 GHVS01021551.1:80-544(+)